ncbi:MAG: FkbM family methyltransferase, partial [Oscillospiraceae bacterium]|nr:FkbM family methyltransferase [Oscillospiraceae bacterium]
NSWRRQGYAKTFELGAHPSCAELGEDMILRAIFYSYYRHITDGFFVDIGAHHPVQYSNTAFFYQLGWRGINVEANPAAQPAFARERPEDINLQCAVTDFDGTVELFIHGNTKAETIGGLSTLVPQNAQAGASSITVPATRLDTLLHKHAAGRPIDFLSMDIEGAELSALQSNNWQLFRPTVLVLEILPKGRTLPQILQDPVALFLQEQGYRAFSVTLYTWFFCDTQGKDLDLVAHYLNA